MISLVDFANCFSNGLLLLLVVGIPSYGYWKKVPVYDTFTEGAKEGFSIVLNIVPHLVAMLVVIGMLRNSGALELIAHASAPLLKWIGIPPETMPLIIMRPFSGGASNGILAELIHTYGGNSYIAKVASTMMGSTETTFYVLAVYFGSIGIQKTRHALPAGLLADLAGVLASVWICALLFR